MKKLFKNVIIFLLATVLFMQAPSNTYVYANSITKTVSLSRGTVTTINTPVMKSSAYTYGWITAYTNDVPSVSSKDFVYAWFIDKDGAIVTTSSAKIVETDVAYKLYYKTDCAVKGDYYRVCFNFPANATSTTLSLKFHFNP